MNDGIKVAIVGLGKVGMPLAARIAARGHTVIGCDVNPEVVATVNRGESPLAGEEGLDEAVRDAVRDGNLTAATGTTDAVRRSDVVVVIVPVLLTGDKQADLSMMEAAASDVAAGLQKGALVIFETTLPVGATRNTLGPILERGSGLKAGADFGLAFSPERVFSGRILRDLATYPKIVGGIDDDSTERAARFYEEGLGVEAARVRDCETAELSKLAELTYRDVNIAFANELATAAQRAGVDVLDVIAAANSQPFSHIHEPGVGVGGHCVPVNPWFLVNGLGPTPIARLARETNDGMGREAARLLDEALGGLKGRTVLILGLAYRGNVKEPYHSAAFLLNDALKEAGARVLIHDPLFTNDEIAARGLEPVTLEPPPSVDAIVLQAAHDEYKTMDFAAFPGCRVVLDGRNVLSREDVEAKGLRYLGVGRQIAAR
ncbi:MAG: nucleotide sugar dehydrogenase [Dehalococcoidia bacterium]